MQQLGSWISLGLVAGSLYWFDADARVLLFAFLITSVFQFVQVEIYLRLARGRQRSRFGSFLLASTRPPTAAEKEWARSAIAQENAMSSFAHFMMVLAGLSFFAFMLTHVNQSKELDFAWPVFVDEIALALGLTLVYVVESLVGGETPIDFVEPDA